MYVTLSDMADSPMEAMDWPCPIETRTSWRNTAMSFINFVSGCGAVGSAVAAGVYTTFSWRVMPRLGMLPTSEAVSAMQAFNRNAVQPPFMIVFFGSAIASVWKIVEVTTKSERTTGDWLCFGGGVLYLAGFALTVVYNVPRNHMLDAVNPGSTRAASVWARYLEEWTAANTIRAVLSVGGALALGAGTVLNVLRGSGRV